MRAWPFGLLLVGVTAGLGVTMPRPAHGQLLGTAWRALDCVPAPTYLPDDYVHQLNNKRRLHRDEAHLQADLARGDAAAVNNDLRRIQFDQVWGEHIRWEIQRDSLHLNIGPDPIYANWDRAATGLVAHPQYPGYGYAPADPTRLYPMPPTAQAPTVASTLAPAPKVPITIAPAGPAGTGVAFAIDGTPHEAASGQPQQFDVAPTAEITYDSGGTLGTHRYSLSAGAYEFRPTAAGWALYKVLPAPATALK